MTFQKSILCILSKYSVPFSAGRTGKREYTADANDEIKLKLEKVLLAENPEVTVSEKPQYIAPDQD